MSPGPPRPTTHTPFLRTGDFPFRRTLLIVIAAAATAGCGAEATIARYSVPKEDAAPSPGTPDLSPGSTAPTGESAWFFKLQGSPSDVAAIADDFQQTVQSVTFRDGSPLWTLPAGWSQRPGSDMRFATIVSDSDPPLEASVISLPVFGSDRMEYVRQNVDRWRGQLGLPAMSGPDWMAKATAASEFKSLDVAGTTTLLVDLAGQNESGAPLRMLGAILLPDAAAASAGTGTGASPAPRAGAAPTDATGPLDYTVPSGWSPGRQSAMRAAAFLVNRDGQQVEITAMTAGGDWLANVNRWREQVGLTPVTAEELSASERKLPVDGADGLYVELVGSAQSILGVMVPRGGTNWFFKLIGDRELAGAEQSRFEEFVRSVTFR
jgi:hypothetical protein